MNFLQLQKYDVNNVWKQNCKNEASQFSQAWPASMLIPKCTNCRSMMVEWRWSQKKCFKGQRREILFITRPRLQIVSQYLHHFLLDVGSCHLLCLHIMEVLVSGDSITFSLSYVVRERWGLEQVEGNRTITQTTLTQRRMTWFECVWGAPVDRGLKNSVAVRHLSTLPPIRS